MERAVWTVDLTAPAVVLGSTQDASDVNAGAAEELGLQVARRRSGGGLVWVDPVATTWLDITIPHNDPLWTDDVSASTAWLGGVFADALSGVRGIAVFSGAFEAGPYGRSLCFAGTAPGEVFSEGGKLVGISQRRNRAGARFQCIVHHRWVPDAFSGVFADPQVARATREIRVAESPLNRGDLLAGLLARMPG